jgi:hypothetical integral membrane protein (TIGR02206 family)
MRHPWLEDFVPFTIVHLLVVAASAALMTGACLAGRRLCHTLHERRFRAAWGIFALAFAAAYHAYYLLPSKFALEHSLPLHVCDLAVVIAAMAMLRPSRPWRALLYFWGIGLSSQAFLTPTLQFGVGYPQFWMFWTGHIIIVGAAVYDLVVGGFRPAARDLRTAILLTGAYATLVFAFDAATKLNYGFLGPTKPDNPTVIDKLGEWPLRVLTGGLLVALEFVLLWAVWPLASAIRRRLAGAPGAPST